jgi:hypothetical protein
VHPQEAAWERLHVRYADEVLGHFLSLRGFYIKLGQVGARTLVCPAPYN